MYVVAGVSGNTGSVVADTLLSQGKPVRVVVRDAKKGEPWKARGAEVAVAELSDAAALTRALTGATGAYLLVPPTPTSPDVLGEQAKVVDAITEAVKASGVGHVVFLSSIGSQHAAGTGPIRTTHYAEKKLGALSTNVTFVRAAYFMENFGGALGALPHGILPTFVKADLKISMIATKDIGTTSAKALLEGSKGHTIIELSGPSEYSAKDVAEELSKIVGKPIAAQEGPESAILETFKGFGVSESMAKLYDEMLRGLNSGHVAWEGGQARAMRGVTPVGEVLAKLLKKG